MSVPGFLWTAPVRHRMIRSIRPGWCWPTWIGPNGQRCWNVLLTSVKFSRGTDPATLKRQPMVSRAPSTSRMYR
ncbi:Uncharacterised protein [Mycobacteroides abscessus subsp. abscessus]|nr:Uncharacterised protein [Mycobacteroides abscessus subsp. abscessus]